uniref:CSON012120 protein n=1 Tax=Culicoides sonorensis TaxID=179676 RepID=A0A336M8Z4_CULSO
MSNLPPLPVLCDTPPPIDDFSNIPDDDYVDFDGETDDYDIVIEEPSKSTVINTIDTRLVAMEIKHENSDDTPLPYLGTRLPPDGTDMTLDFPGDTNTRNLGGELDSPPSLNLSSGSGVEKSSDKFQDDDFLCDAKVIDDDDSSCNNKNVLENNDELHATSLSQTPVLDENDRHIEGGSDNQDEDLNVKVNESQLSMDEITQESTAQNLDIDNEFDDFADFQSVPPDKEVKNDTEEKWQTSPPIPTQDFTFDVDFSNFKADFSDIPPPVEVNKSSVVTELDDSFDDFQDFSAVEPSFNQKLSEHTENTVIPEFSETKIQNLVNDDDDFGDFNDFHTTPVVTIQPKQEIREEQTPLPKFTLDMFKQILDLMFHDATSSSQVEITGDKIEDMKLNSIDFDKTSITNKLKDIESSRALSYRYANSNSSKYLMESIGIDSRNVLFGMKWNPSMPRYAANLSFDPIQPQPLLLQPTPVSSQTSSSASTKPPLEGNSTVKENTTSKPETAISQVPAAQFDWSGAGLVNPLDGSPQIPSSKPTTTIDSIQSGAASQLKSNFVPDEEKISSLNPVPPSVGSSIIDEISTTGTSQYADSNYSFNSSESSEMHHQTPLSPTYGMSVRTITLPETHIFTPEKCTNAISQSIDREATGSGISVKEYHDVEYKLDKSLTTDCLVSNSENSVLNNFNSLSQPVLSGITSIDPILENFTSKMTLKPESMKEGTHNANYMKKDNFPIFGTSPTDIGEKKTTDDDDFSDFQAAPAVMKSMSVEPIKPKPVQATSLVNSMPLSPMHLMKSAANSSLPEPDDDEMLRIEAFARSKTTTQTMNNNTDDDEWSDFTSATLPPTKNTSTNSSKTTTNTSHDDDWSDFVFTTPASMKPIIPNNHQQKQHEPPQRSNNPAWNHQLFQQGNYMPWSTSTGQTPINHIQSHSRQFQSANQIHQQGTGMPELNFIQSQKSAFVSGTNLNRHQIMRK